MPTLTLHVVHEDRASWSARQITGRASYQAAQRRADREYIHELGDMIANCRDPYLRREYIRLRRGLIETAAADRIVRGVEAEVSGAIGAPPRARTPLTLVARRA